MINAITVGRAKGSLIYNTVIRHQALYNNTLGNYNTAFGSDALRRNTTGNHNIAIGYNSQEAFSLYSDLDNTVSVGFGVAVKASNTMCLGNDAMTDIYTNAKINATAFIVSSDIRLKKEIKTIPLGLSFMNKLHPRNIIKTIVLLKSGE